MKWAYFQFSWPEFEPGSGHKWNEFDDLNLDHVTKPKASIP